MGFIDGREIVWADPGEEVLVTFYRAVIKERPEAAQGRIATRVYFRLRGSGTGELECYLHLASWQERWMEGELYSGIFCSIGAAPRGTERLIQGAPSWVDLGALVQAALEYRNAMVVEYTDFRPGASMDALEDRSVRFRLFDGPRWVAVQSAI